MIVKMENEERKIEVDDFKVSQDIPKKKSRFFIKYIVFILILAAITSLAIYFTIDRLDKEAVPKNETNTEEVRKKADDSKYTISSYTETYDTNSIKIIKYYDNDGTVTTDNEDYEDYGSRVEYVQIEGLKNKKIQNEINQKLREVVYSLKHHYVYTSISANFSNILSVVFFNDENKTESLNINLATGEEIKFEELFVSSTPINSYLVNALYETLAWQSINLWEDDSNDLSKVDMSDYEDRFLMFINKYNKKKNNLNYSICANKIYIYGIIDKNILDSEYADETVLELDLTDCINEVTMYKKFLTKENIYEDNSIGTKDTIVFTDSDEDYQTRLNYGKIKDSIFLEEVVLDYDNNFNTNNELSVGKEFIKKLSKEVKENLINETKSNRAVFLQREYQLWYDDENNYTVVNAMTYQATCSTAYFKNDAFLDYIKMKAMPRGDIVLIGFNEYMQDDFPNLSISEMKYEDYYLNQSGEVIARSYEEVQDVLKKEQMQNEAQNEITNTIETNEVDSNNAVIDNSAIVNNVTVDTSKSLNTTNTNTEKNQTQNSPITKVNVVPGTNTISQELNTVN